ncbi:MAG: ABC transporter ATP-binding protein [Chloroflexi bacterium]|nr:MAG: ABC transporter ATP-binding protein [Chloroflexota bacterium]
MRWLPVGQFPILGIWRHISRRRKWQALVSVVLTLSGGVAEIISLGAVVPFIAVLTAPEQVLQNPIASRIAGWAGISAPREMIIPLSVLFCVAAIVAGILRVAQLWFNIRFAQVVGSDLCAEVFRRTLYQPYTFHLNQNTSTILTFVTQKVSAVASGLQSTLNFSTSVFLGISIVGALLAINAPLALATAILLGFFYFVFARQSGFELRKNGEINARESVHYVKVLQESLGGIRDVLLDNSQEVFLNIFRRSERMARTASSKNYVIGSIPRFVLEPAALLVLVSVAAVLASSGTALATMLPLMGVLVFGAQRLMPTLQQAYQMYAMILNYNEVTREVLVALRQPLSIAAFSAAPPPLPFLDEIYLQHLSFRYGEASPLVLDRVDLRISKGSRIGFVGKTGGGKSTTVDLIMGLLLPTGGAIKVDGVELTGDRMRAWQRSVAHVPQSIFLADVSLAENIAFGVPLPSIDLPLVKYAARQAQIDEFIEQQALKYQALVGERGVRLSGGQRQRIGIARALYKRASVLIFDEATSALDSETEQAVMQSIEQLSRELTIILIAHRVTTVERCDSVYEVAGGKIRLVDDVRRLSLSTRAVA